MKTGRKILLGFLLLVVLLELFFLVYLFLENSKEDEIVDKEPPQEVEQENDVTEDENEGDVDQDTEIEFEYSYIVEVVEYEPDSEKYVGYKFCGEQSSCTIYGIEREEIEEGKKDIGDSFMLSFNNYECSGAAAGTSSCDLGGGF